jgi:tRNA(Ile)-lysidine synthase
MTNFRISEKNNRLDSNIFFASLIDLLHSAKFAFPDVYYIAYSGGSDSTALLYLANLLYIEKKIPNKPIAIHINHQLSVNANYWEDHCKLFCKKLELQCITKIITISNSENSLENSARNARYKCFTQILPDNAALLLAHHLNDQTETILHNLFRGSGIHGIKGIPKSRKHKQFNILRPLLNFSKLSIIEYLNLHDIKWIDDDSNQNLSIRRNYIRKIILPKIYHYWPQADESLSKCSNIASHYVENLDTIVTTLSLTIDGEISALSLEKLLTYPSNFQTTILHHWLIRENININFNKISEFARQLNNCTSYTQPSLIISNQIVVKYKQFITITPLFLFNKNDCAKIFSWKIEESLQLPTGHIKITKKLGVNLIKLDSLSAEKKLYIAYRSSCPHKRILLYGKHKKLKNIFQELALPPWIRDKTPILFNDVKIISIIGIVISDEFRTIENRKGIAMEHIPITNKPSSSNTNHE